MKNRASLSVGLLYDDTLDGNDGVAQYVKTLGAWLSRSGHKVSYLVGETELTDWAGGEVYSLSRNTKVTFNSNRLSVPTLSRKKDIRSALDNGRFDVLHVMVPYSPLMSQRVINRAPDTAAIVGTFHVFPANSWVMGAALLLRLVYGRSLRKFDTMLAVSRPAAEFCQKSLGIKPAAVSPNPVDIAVFKKSKPKGKGGMRIVFLGRLVRRKGCEQLLRAFALLPPSINVSLTVAGDGPQRAFLEKLATDLGVDKRTNFLGRIDESDKPALLASADIACFPSLYGESFGIVLVEAMAAGAGVVLGGDNPGYRSILGAKPVCLINPLDSGGFAKRLETLLNDSRQRREVHDWQQRIVKQYDINTVGPQVETVYRLAIAKLSKNSHNGSHE